MAKNFHDGADEAQYVDQDNGRKGLSHTSQSKLVAQKDWEPAVSVLDNTPLFYFKIVVRHF